MKLYSFSNVISSDDTLSARYKLASYYLREFTEISLYSTQERSEKVPLPKLYVAMKWMEYGRHAHSNLTDYTEVFKRVGIIVCYLHLRKLVRICIYLWNY